MHNLGDIANELNRSPVYLRGLQSRFELPVYSEAGYSQAYLSFLRMVVLLRTLNVSEESLRDLWHLEKRLLQLLHVDSTGSPTWFLDACGQTGHPKRRLLLTNYDLGVEVPTGTLQLGLNFAAALPELFDGKEMGEDALRVLGDYVKLCSCIQMEAALESPMLRSAIALTKRLKVHNEDRTQ